MKRITNIFDYIRAQENEYRNPIPVNDKWRWSMKDHILTTELYTNSQLKNEKNDFTPVKNITRPILNLQHRTEDIEVKDVQIYVDNPDKYHLSLLVKKYHDDVYAKENDLDTFFDELNISRIDFGGGLTKKMYNAPPEVVPLQSISFCDQTDILSGPIGIKHFFSPDQLLDMAEVGWGDKSNGATMSLEELITLSRDQKKVDSTGQTAETPGRYIEVYEIHGNLPKSFANPNDTSEKYETRLFICAFYQKQSPDREQGVILYTQPEKESPFKLVKRDPVHGRALGFGGAEELFEPQVWVNYDMIRMQGMLDAASKTILKTTDPGVANRNRVQDMDNLEIIELQPNTDIGQIDTFPRNLALFEKSVTEWESHANAMGSAQEAVQGYEPPSGTPFASLQLQVQQGMGLHQYRRGIFAKHLEEIYRDWIIPHIQKKLTEGTTFLSELSADELQYVGSCVVRNQVNERVKQMVLAGQTPTPDEVKTLTGVVQQDFKQRGANHFIEILKGEFKNTKLGVKVSIAGKSKDLASMVDKLTNVFKAIVANPFILQSPPIGKLFNKIIEASGLDPIDLTSLNVPPTPATKVAETINFKDVPPQAQQAMLQKAGIELQNA